MPSNHLQIGKTSKIQQKNTRNSVKEQINLMNWVKKHKLLTIEVFQFNEYPHIKLEDLWQAFHLIFNFTQN